MLNLEESDIETVVGEDDEDEDEFYIYLKKREALKLKNAAQNKNNGEENQGEGEDDDNEEGDENEILEDNAEDSMIYPIEMIEEEDEDRNQVDDILNPVKNKIDVVMNVDIETLVEYIEVIWGLFWRERLAGDYGWQEDITYLDLDTFK